MTNLHTSGPWTFDPNCFETGIVISPVNSQLVVAECWPMDDTDQCDYEPNNDVAALANARLISAAPEMFALLLLIGDTIASDHPGDWTEETIKMFEEQIKAVTGKAVMA